MKCIDCVFAMDDGLCLCKGGYTLLDADACESFRPRADVKVKMLKAENAKLRELCGFMLRCMKRNHDCDCCLVNGEHCEISYIESDARELGVDE